MPPPTPPGEWTDIEGVPFLRVWGGAGGDSFRKAEDRRLEDRKPDRREMPLATGLGWSDGALSTPDWEEENEEEETPTQSSQGDRIWESGSGLCGKPARESKTQSPRDSVFSSAGWGRSP